MQQSFLKSKSDSKSSGSVVQRGATVDSIEETSSEKKSIEGFVPIVAEYTTKDGLNMKCVSLASHEMAPSKFEELHFLEKKQAKQLFKLHTAADTGNLIMEGRKKAKKQNKGAPIEMASSNFEELDFLENKQAKQLFKLQGRKKQNKGPPVDRISALGSDEEIYSVGADCGMFAAVFTAYSYHYKLRTSPDDWWFCVIKQVARAIDENSQKESVRKMFVDHEGEKTIEVPVEDPTIDTVDYNWFFDQITKAIKENVKVPEFVDGMTADFSTTTPVKKIVSQITLMHSVKHYFDFHMRCGCGIPAVEMLGTEEDWKKITSKLKALRTLLEPMENDLHLPSAWWDVVQNVFCQLLETYQGKPDEKWWSHIMDYHEEYASGRYPTGRYYTGGWITDFLEGSARHLRKRFEPKDFTSGLVSVPLNITHPSGAQDTAALVAGMLGFTVHRTDTSDEVTVQPFQGWFLMLADDSPFLKIKRRPRSNVTCSLT